MRHADRLDWQPPSPPGAARVVQIAILHGDPYSAGDYVMRLLMPDGARMPLHWHTRGEHMTVIAGEFAMGTGSDTTVGPHRHRAGDFMYIPPRTGHWGQANGDVILQFHGIGPIVRTLGAPPSQ